MALQAHTCWEMLETLLVLRRSVSLWHTVSSELGKMERKSLKERRLTDSGSSEAVTGCAVVRGNSLDSSGSSVLLYRPDARTTPSKHGRVYRHRYSG